MRILLLGEFSALHKNLKEGLEVLGHEVDIASHGDGWKNIPSNINLNDELDSSYSNKYIRKAHKLLKLIRTIKKFKNYDVVQIIAPLVFPYPLKFNKLIMEYIIKNNGKVFLVGAGASNVNSAIADFLQKKFKYPELYIEATKGYKKPFGKLWSQTSEGRAYNDWLLNRISGYIPIMYEYAQPFRDISYDKLCATIPIPMNIEKVKYSENLVKDKLVIFHGLNRPEQKGTPLIKEAFDRLEKNYPDKVECIIDGKMPLEQYLKLLERVNVIVDQVYSVSLGVNGVYGLALGKVVVGGGEPEFLKEFNLESSPLVRIQNDSNDIYLQLEKLVKQKQHMSELGYQSRLFAEQLHDYRKVAEQYIDVWTK